MEPILSYQGLWESKTYLTRKISSYWADLIIVLSENAPEVLRTKLMSVPIEILGPAMSTKHYKSSMQGWTTILAITSAAPELWERTTNFQDAFLSNISSGILADSPALRACLYSLLKKIPLSLRDNLDFRLKLLSAIWDGFSVSIPYYVSADKFLKLYLNVILYFWYVCSLSYIRPNTDVF